MIQDKERNYLKKHCEMLEKENEQYKAEITALQMQLISYTEGEKYSASLTKHILKEAVLSSRSFKKMNRELAAKIRQANQLLLELKQLRPQYQHKMERTLSEISKTIL